MKHSVHFPFSKNHNINTYSIDLLRGKCTECFIYHVGAHLKALGILVWILGPESTTATVLFSQSWFHCEPQARQAVHPCQLPGFQFQNTLHQAFFFAVCPKTQGEKNSTKPKLKGTFPKNSRILSRNSNFQKFCCFMREDFIK